MTKIADVKRGPIRTIIEANKKALAMFSQKEQNNIVRDSMQRVGNMWITVFFPRRFTDYARRFLRYNPRASWETAKTIMAQTGMVMKKNRKPVIAPQPTPLVLTGDLRSAAMNGIRGESKATRSRAYCAIRIPLGHAIRKETAAVLKIVPKHERDRIAQEFQRAIVDLISASFMGGRAKSMYKPGKRPSEIKERRNMRRFSRRSYKLKPVA